MITINVTIPTVQYYRIQDGKAVKDNQNPNNKTATIPAKVFAEWLFDQFGIEVTNIESEASNA